MRRKLFATTEIVYAGNFENSMPIVNGEKCSSKDDFNETRTEVFLREVWTRYTGEDF